MKAVLSSILLLAPAVALAGPEPRPMPVGTKAADFKLRDYRGTEHALADFAGRKFLVIAFTGVDCPLAKLYGTRLAELAKQYEPKGVAFVGIDANQQDSVTAIGHYARTHGIAFPILKDVGNAVADRFGAERTPEVFVLDQDRVVRYHGRIDDQYGVGYQRKKAEHKELTSALDELLAGKPVSTPQSESVGCLIGRIREPARDGKVTYSNQIARIIQKRCLECHHPGEIGPFSLTNYEEVVGWAEMMREVLQQNRMPPWHADPRYGHFANDNRMPDEEKQLVYQWVKDGAPEGDPRDLPKPVTFEHGWRIKPDMVIPLPKPFIVPATGDVVYQFFVVDPGFTEDKWVKASEVRPGNRSVVHHALIFVQPPGGDRDRRGFASDWLAATAPGAWPQITPDGMAKRIPAGSRLLFQMHYTPNGTETVDRTEVALQFADPKTIHKEVRTRMAANPKLEIPAGDPHVRVDAEAEFEQDMVLINLMPHTHLRGKQFRFEAVYPDGKTETLLDIPNYDFNWQQTYYLAEPKIMPKGSKLHCTAYYDNSANNPANPDPTVTVHWGDQTWEEMLIGYHDVVPVHQDLQKDAPEKFAKAYHEVPLDPALKALAARATHSQADFDAFAAAVKKAVPAVDRVCMTEFTFDRLKVLHSAYPGEVPSHFAETGFEQEARGFALVFYALRGGLVVHPDLKDKKQARGVDLYMMSKTLASSLHVPVIWEARPATVNFWSKEPNAFTGETVSLLATLGEVVAGKK
jgi:peroxiredoxin